MSLVDRARGLPIWEPGQPQTLIGMLSVPLPVPHSHWIIGGAISPVGGTIGDSVDGSGCQHRDGHDSRDDGEGRDDLPPHFLYQRLVSLKV
jgi:hypothetical protein